MAGRTKKPDPTVRIEIRNNGKIFDAALVCTGSVIRTEKGGNVLMLVDQEGTLPFKVKWHDKPRTVKLVLKIYCKLSPQELRGVARKRALSALEAGSPILK